MAQKIIPFNRGKNKTIRNPRDSMDGVAMLGNMASHLDEISNIEQEIADSIVLRKTSVIDEETGEEKDHYYQSTTLDKETIAVYHTRINARKLQCDIGLKLLNKVMPDLKALDDNQGSQSASDKALSAFARAAAKE